MKKDLSGYWSYEEEELPELLATPSFGLSSEEAGRRLKDQGEKPIVRQKKTSELLVFLRQFKTSIVLILVAATFISALSGEWIDAAIILMIVLSNCVRRDGTVHDIPARFLVQGDIIRLSADRCLLKTMVLQLDPSIRIGESMPVMKQVGPVPLKLFSCLGMSAFTLVLPYLTVGFFDLCPFSRQHPEPVPLCPDGRIGQAVLLPALPEETKVGWQAAQNHPCRGAGMVFFRYLLSWT